MHKKSALLFSLTHRALELAGLLVVDWCCFPACNRPSRIPGPGDQGDNLEQGETAFGGRGSGQGMLKQTGHT